MCIAGLAHSKGQAVTWKSRMARCLRGPVLNSWFRWLQELVEIVGRSTGIVLMAPPSENKAAQTTMNTLLSACNSKQKVRAGTLLMRVVLACAGQQQVRDLWSCAVALQRRHGAHRLCLQQLCMSMTRSKLPRGTLSCCPCQHLMTGPDDRTS